MARGRKRNGGAESWRLHIDRNPQRRWCSNARYGTVTRNMHLTTPLGRPVLLAITLGLLAACRLQADPDPSRPRVGVVLGGGGAKGLAHIGVLKALEAQGIPIDAIAGTSMGAIVGGLYAAGMSPDEIEEVMTGVDWWDVLADPTPRRYLQVRRKLQQRRYLPGLEVGMRLTGLRVPPGVAAGQKLNNMLQALTLSYANLESFDHLSIPFRAVATDIQSGEPVVLDRGNLGLAMRASMSVPGAFTPVHADGRILVDGGVVNNIPVDVMRAMNVDYIIAVDVIGSGALAQKQKTDTLFGIVLQSYFIMLRNQEKQSLAQADIVITPDVADVGFADFHHADRIVPRGEAAVESVRKGLTALAAKTAHTRRPAPTLPPLPRVRQVVIKGNDAVDTRIIRARSELDSGDPLTLHAVKRDLSRIYGLGDFQQALFSLSPVDTNRADVVYEVMEKPWGPNILRFGALLETDFDHDTRVELLLGATCTHLNRLGAEWHTDVILGTDQLILTEFFQPLRFDGLFYVLPHALGGSELTSVFDDGQEIATLEENRWQLGLDIGVQLAQYAELRTGCTWGRRKLKEQTGDPPDLPPGEATAGWRTQLAFDQLDRSTLPRNGLAVILMGEVQREDWGASGDFERLAVDIEGHITRGRHTLQLSAYGGTGLDSDVPFAEQFTLGGPTSFAGLAPGELRGPYAASISPGYRLRIARLPPLLGENVYLAIRFDAGNVWQNRDDVTTTDLIYGLLGAIAADTVAGPLYVGYGRTEDGRDRAFLSVGSRF